MKVSDLVRELNLTVFCGEAGLDAEISGGYTSDLLSDVMGHIDEGMLWVTMQTHQNVVAVATLKDAAAVLIVNGASPDEETLEKGKEEDVPLLGTPLSAFEVTGKYTASCYRNERVPGRFAPAHLSFALRKPGDEPTADCGNGPRTGIGCHCCDGS